MKIEELINKNYNYLSDIDIDIAKYVLSNKDKIGNMGINQLAQNSFTSKSSVLRFSQKIGFSGYSDMKNFIKREDTGSDSTEESKVLFEQIITDTERTLEYLKNVDLESIYRTIDESDNIYVMTTGVAQENQAEELQRLFMMMGRSIHILPGVRHSSEYRRIIEKLTSDDLIIVFSLSGENPNLEGLLDVPEIKGAKTISLTNFKSNLLAGKADFNLYASSTLSPVPQNWWVQSISPFFVVIEALIFGYMDYKSKVTEG